VCCLMSLPLSPRSFDPLCNLLHTLTSTCNCICTSRTALNHIFLFSSQAEADRERDRERERVTRERADMLRGALVGDRKKGSKGGDAGLSHASTVLERGGFSNVVRKKRVDNTFCTGARARFRRRDGWMDEWAWMLATLFC
jgi:hypothetical protein